MAESFTAGNLRCLLVISPPHGLTWLHKLRCEPSLFRDLYTIKIATDNVNYSYSQFYSFVVVHIRHQSVGTVCFSRSLTVIFSVLLDGDLQGPVLLA